MITDKPLACFHVGVKGLVRNKDRKILLLKRELPNGRIYWDVPGGRLQKDEGVIETLKRELFEETGLRSLQSAFHFCTLLTDIKVQDEEDVGLIFIIYLCDVPSDFHLQLSSEHFSFVWASVDEAVEKLTQYPAEFKEKLKHSRYLI